MGDTLIHLASRLLQLMGLWGCGDRGSDLHQIHGSVGCVQRTGAEPAALRMDVAELDIGVAHQPVASFGLDHANRFADQRLADKDQFAGPFDLAVAAHPADRDIATVARIREPVRVRPRRGLVGRSRCLLSQSLMRPLVVVENTELVETLLLRRYAVGRRHRGLLLEGAVNPLVTAILLWLAGNDPLRPDAELEPPYRQPRQAARSGRGKRRTVVRTDRQRQPMLAECRLEDRPHMLVVGAHHCLTAQQVTAVRIAQGERIAAPPVAGAKPPLEIGAPHVIGRRHRGKRPGIGRAAASPRQALDQTLAPQPIADRARRRNCHLRMPLAQLHPQLLRTPMAPALAQLQHRLHYPDVVCLAVPQRGMRALPQPRRTLTEVPPQPFVAGLAADPILPAQHRHLILARQNPSDKLRPFVHPTGLFPWHRQAPPADCSDLSPIYPVNSVTTLPGSYTPFPLSPLGGEGCEGLARRSGALPSPR